MYTDHSAKATEAELKLLLVEDSEEDAMLLVRALTRQGLRLSSKRVEDARQLSEALANDEWDIVVSDFNLPTLDGMQTLRSVREIDPDLPVILVSGAVGEETAVEAMKAGARDFVSKSNLSRLGTAITREMEEKASREQRTHLESALRQAQKLEGVGRLAGGVAHDFNNLLTVIKGFVELSLDHVDDMTKDYLLEVQRATESAQRLASDLLTFSRRSPNSPRVVNATEVVESQISLLKHLLSDDIELAFTPGESGNVRIDPTLLEQVMMNLVANARDAMPSGGTLCIEMSVRSGSPQADAESESAAVIRVSDTGVGMTEEVRSQIFEPFFTTKGPGSGTGLGLSTCYGIIAQAGGRIEVHSQVGMGTSFEIVLPLIDEPVRQASAAERRQSPKTTGGTILLAEDEGSVRMLAVTVLESKGYNVIPAPNGKMAIELAREEGFENVDLVLSDVMMPVMGGVDLANRFRELNPAARIALMSGFTDDISHVTQHFLAKPFTASALVEFVARAMTADSDCADPVPPNVEKVA